MPAELLEKPATVETTVCDVPKIKSIVADSVEDCLHSANQAIKRVRHVAEDVVEEARHTVKQRPFQTVGTVFAAGIVTGGLLGWLALRRRH
jgi:ElaB/YqjD/DUF883 family membrane-anchored ribosome-binding protein